MMLVASRPPLTVIRGRETQKKNQQQQRLCTIDHIEYTPSRTQRQTSQISTKYVEFDC